MESATLEAFDCRRNSTLRRRKLAVLVPDSQLSLPEHRHKGVTLSYLDDCKTKHQDQGSRAECINFIADMCADLHCTVAATLAFLDWVEEASFDHNKVSGYGATSAVYCCLLRQCCAGNTGDNLDSEQPLLSENSKFWAQVEPVPKHYQGLLGKKSPGYGRYQPKGQSRGPQMLTQYPRKVHKGSLPFTDALRSYRCCGVAQMAA